MSPWFTIPLVVVSIASFLMQARRIHQVGAAGVSRATWLGLLVSVSLWSAYGVSVSDWTITATNVPLVVVASSIILAMVRDGAARHRDLWLAGGGALSAAVVAITTVGAGVVGAAAATIVVVRIVPQLLQSLRSADVTGISITTWLGNIVNKVPWAIYGVGVADVWMAWASSIAVVLSLAIVVAVLVRRGPVERDAPTEVVACSAR